MPGLTVSAAQHRPRPAAEPLTSSLAGSIYWLPKDATDTRLESGCYGHPVLVLSTWPQAGDVEILIVTSLRGKDLLKKFPGRSRRRRAYLPIKPSSVHPDLGILLTLSNPNLELDKKSYVKTNSRHAISLSALRPYVVQGHNVALSADSLTTVKKHCNFMDTTASHPPRQEARNARIPELPPPIVSAPLLGRPAVRSHPRRVARPDYSGDRISDLGGSEQGRSTVYPVPRPGQTTPARQSCGSYGTTVPSASRQSTYSIPGGYPSPHQPSCIQPHYSTWRAQSNFYELPAPNSQTGRVQSRGYWALTAEIAWAIFFLAIASASLYVLYVGVIWLAGLAVHGVKAGWQWAKDGVADAWSAVCCWVGEKVQWILRRPC